MANLKRTITLASLLAFAITVPACNGTGLSREGTQLPAPGTATATQAPPTQQPTSAVSASATVEATAANEPAVSAPMGLQVVYLQAGNLWSWTEAGGNVLLTGTGDLSSVRLSEDGQLLAFMRGREAWTIRMDGTQARLLVVQQEQGGALWFAQDGSLLAISTANHIDVVDLINETLTTVFTYPVRPEAYYPEVIWAADGSGFKTVIPPAPESSQAEFLFVFTNGTVANLAKFSMDSPAENPPFISPDGGYVIYVAKVSDGKESLHLMDSSGAAKSYGEPAMSVHVYGWLPDSKYFVYARENPKQFFLGNVMGNQPVALDGNGIERIRWVDADHFLALIEKDLYLEDSDGGQMLIAEDVTDFDFAD